MRRCSSIADLIQIIQPSAIEASSVDTAFEAASGVCSGKISVGLSTSDKSDGFNC